MVDTCELLDPELALRFSRVRQADMFPSSSTEAEDRVDTDSDITHSSVVERDGWDRARTGLALPSPSPVLAIGVPHYAWESGGKLGSTLVNVDPDIADHRQRA